MNKKSVKTSDVLKVYNIIGQAKFGKMADDEKIKAWKIARKLKPIATKFEDDTKDAAEKFKEGFKDFDQRLQKAQEYERLKQNNDPTIDVMTTAEYDAFIKDFKKYQELCGKAIKEFADKEVKITFEQLSEESFSKLAASNDWTLDQTAIAGEFICEEE